MTALKMIMILSIKNDIKYHFRPSDHRLFIDEINGKKFLINSAAQANARELLRELMEKI